MKGSSQSCARTRGLRYKFNQRIDMIELGSMVRDLVTGFEGVAENRATFLFGCDRYCVQPTINDGLGCTERGGDVEKIQDSMMIDEPQLVVLDRAPVMQPPPEPRQRIPLGHLVKDPVRGMTGVAIGRAVYLNGCSRILVEPKAVRGESHSWWVDEQRLILRKSIIKPELDVTTGGPAPSSSKY